jgi:hypothetical protein
MNLVDDDIVEVICGKCACAEFRIPRLDRRKQRVARPIIMSADQQAAEVQVAHDLGEAATRLLQDPLRVRDVEHAWRTAG